MQKTQLDTNQLGTTGMRNEAKDGARAVVRPRAPVPLVHPVTSRDPLTRLPAGCAAR